MRTASTDEVMRFSLFRDQFHTAQHRGTRCLGRQFDDNLSVLRFHLVGLDDRAADAASRLGYIQVGLDALTLQGHVEYAPARFDRLGFQEDQMDRVVTVLDFQGQAIQPEGSRRCDPRQGACLYKAGVMTKQFGEFGIELHR